MGLHYYASIHYFITYHTYSINYRSSIVLHLLVLHYSHQLMDQSVQVLVLVSTVLLPLRNRLSSLITSFLTFHSFIDDCLSLSPYRIFTARLAKFSLSTHEVFRYS